MSTKTLHKRIALVAVSALGFGLVSVAPASAGVGVVDLDNTAINLVAGVQTRVPVKITTIASAFANNDTLTITPTVDSTLVSISGTSDVSRETGGLDIAAGDIATNRFSAPAASADGVITLAENGDATEATAARVNGKTIGSLVVTAFAPGSYTLTLTKGGTGPTAGAETVRLNVSPAQGAALAAQTLADGTNGTIFKVSADTPTIMVTRPSGQPTSAGAISLRVNAAPEVTKFPVGSVIRAGALTPGAGVAATTIASIFGTSYSFPALTNEGLYEFTAFVDANASNLVDSGEASATVSFRVVGIPDNAVASIDSGSVQTAAGVTKNFAVVVTLTDALGYPTYGAANAVPTLTESAVVTATLAADTTTNLLGASTPDGGGLVRIGTGNTYRINVAYAHATEAVDRSLRYTPVCPTTACTVNTRTSYSVITTGIAAVATSLAMTSATGIFSGTVGATSYTTVIPADATVATTANAAAGVVAVTADPAVTTFSLTLTGTAAKVYTVTTTPGVNTPASRITAPTTVTTLADGKVTFVVTVTTPVAAKTAGAGISAIADSFSVIVAGTTDNTFGYSVTYAAPTAAWTLSPAATSNARVLQKSSNTVTAVLTDVYGRILANKAYTVSVAGRNVSAAAGTTNASGAATFTFTDADTRSYDLTVGFPTDTVTFSHTDASGDYTAVTGAVTYTYVATLAAVGSVTVTVPAGTRIDQVRANPAAPTTIAYTATARLATGAAAGAGVLVTFAGSADDIFLNGINTGVTNTSGQATVNVYRNKIGFQTITATANGVSGTGTSVLWSNDPGSTLADGTTATGISDARNVAVTATQSIVGGSAATVVAKVTDRWGNAVEGVLVTWSIAGVGRIVTGGDSTVGTDSNGQAQIQVTSLESETGTMTATATIGAVGGAIDLAGKVVASDTAATAFTTSANVAGVTAGNNTSAGKVEFTKNTSTSTADALLALAQALGTKDQANATVDAAAEALDAANAATDAANAAAEAADAATAAAQDASDAVAALSAQVAEAIAGLKKQLVSLTNLVIKIQKKVKA